MQSNRHGGNIRQLTQSAGLPTGKVIDFSANINPLGPPDWLRPLISATISSLVHYPDPDAEELLDAAACHYGANREEIIAGNGSTEILYRLPGIYKARRAVVPVPSYGDYASAFELAGLPVDRFCLQEKDGFKLDVEALGNGLQGHELVLIGHPNNPTGLTIDADALRKTALQHAKTAFIVDEAFADFIDGIDRLVANRPPNVLVLLSLTKFYAIPGLRLGLAIADRDVAERLRKMMPPWSVNTLAQAVGARALNDRAYVDRTRSLVREERERLFRDLQSIPGLFPYPGEANFLLVRIEREGIDAPVLARKLLANGIAVRVCENFEGLDSRFFRVAVRTAEENERLCHSLGDILAAPTRVAGRSVKPSIMLQGTSSNAGKSVLAAAFCRILLQDGYSVAPFKAQNMSLNSYVTRNGGEMGRAQVVQAQACRIDPDVRMNPVLLKPSSDTGSQVIIMGKPVGNMDVGAYIRYKPEAFKTAREAYDSLASEYDVIVLEGAGSPAEINLKHHDIVNMTMARHAKSPVLVVGDIDRGGVFASFVGTMELLTEQERKMMAGFVINRFRGDKTLLGDAIAYTTAHTGLPTFGVVPYVRDLGLPEEDSVTFKNSRTNGQSRSGDAVEIALIDLPHISNFTDYDALRLEPDVNLKIIRTPQDINHPDAVILPGSKNVIGDMDYLMKTGLADRISQLVHGGRTELVGICGGFQILGREIADPHGLESGGKTISGLGLMPISTTLALEKTLKCVTARHLDSGLAVYGYEIHHGLTDGFHLPAVIVREDGLPLGVKSEDGLVWGTYLHGVFDADAFRRWFIDRLRIRRSLPPVGKIVMAYDLEPAFNRLADVVRESLDLDAIYRLMGLR